MQTTVIHSQTIPNNFNEVFLDNLIPTELLKIIFDQVIHQKIQSLRDISSILLTCKKWKIIFEENPCISLIQALFQLKESDQSTITLKDCIIPDQKNQFTSQELKLIDGVCFEKRFKKLLMLDLKIFQPKSLFLPLLNRYLWIPEVCKKSANKNIQNVAEEQLSILNSLASGAEDQRLNLITKEVIEKLYRGGRGRAWGQAEKFVISTLKQFPNLHNKELFIQVSRCFGASVFDIDEEFKKDREIVLAVMQQDGLALEFADESLKKDREIVLAAVQQTGYALQFADETLKKDREIVLAAVQQDGYALQYADKSLKKDREIALAAIKQNSYALQLADKSFKKDEEIVLAAVQKEGLALQFADESLKKDRKIVLAAVKQRGWALQYIDKSLKKDREIVLAAVQQSGYALQYADETLKKDREIVLAAVQQDRFALQFADESLKQIINF